MRLYLDTEFTNLIPGAKLISIALVDDTGDFFYAELTDTYSLKDCSDFVKTFVLPILKGKEYQMSWHECSIALGNWIEEKNVQCMIASDNPSWDIPYINDLLRQHWPANLRTDSIFQVRIDSAIQEELVMANDFYIHNALDDAKVMQLGTILQET